MQPELRAGVERVLAHPVVLHLVQALRRRPAVELTREEQMRRAAVTLILRVGAADGVELLMIKRAVYDGDPWSGHVALPGGRQEPGDRTLEETAIRETYEETAIDLTRDGSIIGRLDDVRPRTIVLPRIVIAPFIAVLGADVPVMLSVEVAEAFWVPLEALRDPTASREIVLELPTGARRVSSFQHMGYTIWGLTERILRQFLELLEQE